VKLYWARSARKHRVSKARSQHVIEHCGLRFRIPAPSGQDDDRLVYLGDDANGTPLEVVAVELSADELLVIHAMPLRAKYLMQYQEAKRWRA
jgi:hypothetical protein